MKIKDLFDKMEVALRSDAHGHVTSTAQNVPRTSHLQGPNMLLTGHQGDIWTGAFDPSGQHFASGSSDKSIFLWNVFGECENYGVLKGHQGPVLDLQWTPSAQEMVSGSADHTAILWDAQRGELVRKWKGHSAIVNAIGVTRSGASLFLSASDDASVKMWDARYRQAVLSLDHAYPVTTVAFTASSEHILSAGIDNTIYVWEPRMKRVIQKMEGHGDTITGIVVSPDGRHLLSASMDASVRIWDVASGVCLKLFLGAAHGGDKHLLKPAWSPVGTTIACGSADRSVLVWDVASRDTLYKLPGHRGTVNQVAFHPFEPILASVSSDKQILLGELLS